MDIEETIRSRRVIDSLYRISSVVSRLESEKEAFDLIIDEIVQVLGVSSASICLINAESRSIEIANYRGLPEHAKKMQLPLGVGITGWVALHGRSLWVNNVAEDPRYYSLDPNVQAEMAVPMLGSNGVVLGVVNVDTTNPEGFTEGDLKVLTLLTNEATNAVRRIWVIDELKNQREQLQAILKTGQRLVSKIQIQEILRDITKEAKRIFKSKGSALFLLADNGEDLILEASAGLPDELTQNEHLTIAESSIGVAITKKRLVEVSDLPKVEEHHFTKMIQQEKLMSMLCAPLIIEDRAIGVLNVYLDKKHRFSNLHRSLLETLANYSSIAIQNSKLYDRVFETEEYVRKNDKLNTLGLLAAEIAHEIRNPLTVIKLLFESITLDIPEDSFAAKDSEVISEKIKHLEEIIERVLSFGKGQQVVFARHSFTKLIEDTIYLVRLKLRQQKILVEFSSESELWVKANRAQIQQVLLNLILNSTDAMPKGGKISICLTAENERCYVTVKDTGEGIPVTLQPKIFESFLSGKSSGTGLGLGIVKQILKSHHGDIELLSSNEEGTQFQFWLPAEK